MGGVSLKSKPVELGEGYSISIRYDEEGPPTIHVKTYGDVDLRELLKEIRRRYPHAEIRGLEGPPVIEVIAKPGLKRKRERFKKRKPKRKTRRRKLR